MTRDDALATLAAYGGDAARWPATEAAALLALAASDSVVAEALAQARQLDGLLTGWARDVAPAAFDIAAITRLPAAAPPALPATRRWLAGGLMAAAMAAGIAFMVPVMPAADPLVKTASPPNAVSLATAPGEAFGSDAEVFATVFTPTVDEDSLI